MWLVLGVCVFAAKHFAGPVGGTLVYNTYVAATKKAMSYLVSGVQALLKWLLKLAVNILSWLARRSGWLIANGAIWLLNRIRAWNARRVGRPVPARIPYRVAPAWTNHFRRRRNQGDGAGHH